MNKRNVNARKNMKNYSSKLYKRTKIKKGKTYRFFRWVFLFFIVATISYLVTLMVYSFVNRKHCTFVEIDDSYANEPAKTRRLDLKSKKGGYVKTFKENLKAVEIPKNLIFQQEEFKNFLKKTKENGENAVVVTFKDEGGNLLYKSDVELAKKWGTITNNAVDPLKIVERIKEQGLIPIVKINVLLDGKAPLKDPDNTFLYNEYNYKAGKVFSFIDISTKKRVTYLNPCKRLARSYIFDIVKEMRDLGFSYVILENFSFPYAKFSEDMEDFDEIDRNYVMKEFIKTFKKIDIPLIFGYDFDVLYEDKKGLEKRELCYGTDKNQYHDMNNLGFDLNMLIIYRYEDFKKYREEILRYTKGREDSFILKLEFSENLDEVIRYLEENSLKSYVILKNG